jgi:hypothetical protein
MHGISKRRGLSYAVPTTLACFSQDMVGTAHDSPGHVD